MNFIFTQAGVGLELKNFTLYPTFQGLRFNEIDEVSSTVGDVNVDLMKEVLNAGTRIAVPFVNKYLANGYTFEHNLNNTLQIESAEFNA